VDMKVRGLKRSDVLDRTFWRLGCRLQKPAYPCMWGQQTGLQANDGAKWRKRETFTVKRCKRVLSAQKEQYLNKTNAAISYHSQFKRSTNWFIMSERNQVNRCFSQIRRHIGICVVENVNMEFLKYNHNIV